jgi:hypothetical protein
MAREYRDDREEGSKVLEMREELEDIAKSEG